MQHLTEKAEMIRARAAFAAPAGIPDDEMRRHALLLGLHGSPQEAEKAEDMLRVLAGRQTDAA